MAMTVTKINVAPKGIIMSNVFSTGVLAMEAAR